MKHRIAQEGRQRRDWFCGKDRRKHPIIMSIEAKRQTAGMVRLTQTYVCN